MGKQGTHIRWTAAVIAFAVAISAGAALAGGTAPFGDDDNDFEGRVEKNEDTYFGFDLKSNGDKVAGISASSHTTARTPRTAPHCSRQMTVRP